MTRSLFTLPLKQHSFVTKKKKQKKTEPPLQIEFNSESQMILLF